MKVTLTLPDKGGCAYYRAIYPGRAAAAIGAEVEYAENLQVRVQHDANGIPHPVEVEDFDSDLIVMQRPLRKLNLDLIPILQRQGVAVAVDIDDDFSCVDPDHIGWKHYQPETSPLSNRKVLARACALADHVICTTPALATRYAPHGRVTVLPNYVPKAMLGTVAPRDGRTVGWGGYVETHPHDLEVTRGGIGAALQQADARFVCIGSGNKVAEQLGIPGLRFSATGPQEFQDYPYAIAALDVGIVPLADTAFNRAKSGLKGLEYAAVGVPFVASPTPDYQRLAAEGIGVLAKGQGRDWSRKVRALLADGGDCAHAAKAAVAARHTYEGHAQDWIDAWARAVETARKRNLPRTPSPTLSGAASSP